MTMLDPVTLAVLNGRLVQIADEMDATLYRSAFNPIIAEAHDACHGLYHADTGATLVQGTTGLPIFVGAMAFAVKAVIDKARKDGGLAAGDTCLFNDPYDGGTHLNDIRLVRRIVQPAAARAFRAHPVSAGHGSRKTGALRRLDFCPRIQRVALKRENRIAAGVVRRGMARNECLVPP